MKSIIALALGLMLLVSAAAATGTSNKICVEIDQEAEGDCITGTDLCQVTEASAFVFGCDNEVEQFMDFYANDNDLVGYGDDASLSQIGKMIGNASGTGNDVDQNILFEAYENCLTDSKLTQLGIEKADAIGCDNEIEQLIGTEDDPYDPNEANENILICSELVQWSDLRACAEGTNNDLYQVSVVDTHFANNNCLTGSTLWQQICQDLAVVGCDNEAIQVYAQIASDNKLTASLLNQKIDQEAIVVGDCNQLEQFAFEKTLALNNAGNKITDGSLVQTAKVCTEV